MPIPLASGLPFVGGLLDTAASAYGQKASIKASEKMAKNKHQWEVADLRAAGLNPILSALGGGSPSAGGGGGIKSNLAASAKDSMRLNRELDLMSAQAQQHKAAARRENATADKIEALGPLADFMEKGTGTIIDGLPKGIEALKAMPGKAASVLSKLFRANVSGFDVRMRQSQERLLKMIEEEEAQSKRKKPPTVYIRKGRGKK